MDRPDNESDMIAVWNLLGGSGAVGCHDVFCGDQVDHGEHRRSGRHWINIILDESQRRSCFLQCKRHRRRVNAARSPFRQGSFRLHPPCARPPWLHGLPPCPFDTLPSVGVQSSTKYRSDRLYYPPILRVGPWEITQVVGVSGSVVRACVFCQRISCWMTFSGTTGDSDRASPPSMTTWRIKLLLVSAN